MSIGRVPGATGIQPTIVDAKGDLIVATAADSVDRLAVGTDNAVLMALSSTSAGLNWAGKRTFYTPTWTASTTNPVLGNGSIFGNSIRIGDLVFFTIQLQMGSTTTYGSGDYLFSLPVTPTAAGSLFGMSQILDAGVAWYGGYFPENVVSGTTSTFRLRTASGTGSAVTPTVPFTFGNGDIIYIQGVYGV
jgi:hypothetical protein